MTLFCGFLGLVAGVIGVIIGANLLAGDLAGFGELAGALMGLVLGYPLGVAVGLVLFKYAFHYGGSVLLGLFGGATAFVALIILTEALNLGVDPNILFLVFLISVPMLAVAGFTLGGKTWRRRPDSNR
ncbi:MAG: hypothetical protein IZT57_05280 [Chloroflexi bacterium]|nr:hypothetical protein [Chloroflexota bacterium]